MELLTATVSHEMKTPLNSIIQTSEQLSPCVDEKGERLRKINLRSGKMLLSLVNDMLDQFQIKNQQFQKHFSNFSIDDVVDDTLEMIEIQANVKNIDLQKDIEN